MKEKEKKKNGKALTLKEINFLLRPFIPGRPYIDYKKIKCKKCGNLFISFFFGDESLDREVIQDCPHCKSINLFIPRNVVNGPSSEYVKGR